MPSLAFLNISFVRTLEIVNEIGRVVIALGFRNPPPEYTFRGLEPVYKECIEHYQGRVERKWREVSEVKGSKSNLGSVNGEQAGGEGKVEREDEQPTKTREDWEKGWDELEGLLGTHARLISNLSILTQHPHLQPRPHDDLTDLPPLDAQFGPERYIDPPFSGYGFSNDYIRQWFAAIPGPVGRHFEKEESGKANLTKIFTQICIAIAGGAALLTPMIVMTFVMQQKWRLVIVSVATVLFGTAFAIVSTSKENVLASTAAYAAVMVVYIGSASKNVPTS